MPSRAEHHPPSRDRIERDRTLLELAVSRSPTIFYIADLGGERPIKFISSNVETMTGHKPASFLGDHGSGRRFIHPDDLAGYMEALERLRVEGALAYEYRFATVTGDHLWFRDELRLIQDQAGGSDGFVGCMTDITDRKRAEAQLREAEAEVDRLSRLLRDAVESLPSGFVVTDADHRVVLCNTAFAAPYGLEPQAMVGRHQAENVRDFFPNVRRFDGEPVTGTEADIARIVERLKTAHLEPIEVELTNGDWRLLTGSRTSDGGSVTIRTDITRQKRAELELRESEGLIRRVLEACPAPVAMIRARDGLVIYESPALTRLFGDAPVVGPQYAETFYVDPAERRRLMVDLRRRGVVDGFEVRMRKDDGTPFWAAVSARLIEYKGEEVIVSITTDLTERKEREAELRHARETLEDAIESLSEGFALYDADDRLVMCNRRYREFNRPSADVLKPGIRWIDFVRHGAERGQYVDAAGDLEGWLARWARERRRMPMTREFQQSDGRWFRSSVRRTRHGGAVVIRSDITQRREMERALRDSEAMIRRVLEACPVPIGMTRAEDGLILYESPASKALFGRDPAAGPVYARDYFVDPAARERYVAQLRAERQIDGFQAQFCKADGTTFWAELSARLIDYQGEEVIVSSTLDLTERHAVEAEMARQREALHQSEKLSAMGQMLAGVAHELNNPLSVVVGQALLLKETATDPAITERATKIGNAADRCARIVKTFLAMARQHPAKSAAVDLNETVEAALEVTGYSLRASDIDVSLRLARELPPVWGDPDQLNQVLTNLILNAQHALQEVPGPRRLRIATGFRRHQGEVVVKVKDNGPGIPQDIRSRIFEPLFTTKEVGKGTGIGLAVCHRIVDAHRGTIRMDSAPGEGTSFVVRLPASLPGAAEGPAEVAEAAGLGALSALVIDDEPDVAELLADILRADGHRVETADSGSAALVKMRRKNFDIMLSDLRMPNLDGPMLYRILEERHPHLVSRLAFITGDTMSPRIKTFLHLAGRPYIEKPITPREVRNLVGLIVGHGRDGEPERD